MNKYEILELYTDIINGYSSVQFQNSIIYLKHFSVFEDKIINQIYNEKFNLAVKRGLPTYQQKIKLLRDNGIWTEQNDQEIEELEFYLNNLQKSKKNAIVPSQIQQFNKDIEQTQLDLDNKKNLKESFVGLTAEKYATQQSNNEYIYYSLFKDKELSYPFYQLDEFKRLEVSELNELIKIFNNKISFFNEYNIKTVALDGNFQTIFRLCNSVYEFWGQPLHKLTYYQISLFSYGTYYKNILSDCGDNIPQNVINDPKKLEDWYIGFQNTNKVINKYADKDGNLGIMGATQEDLKQMGLDDGSSDQLFKALSEKGELSMQDLMKMDGAI